MENIKFWVIKIVLKVMMLFLLILFLVNIVYYRIFFQYLELFNKFGLTTFFGILSATAVALWVYQKNETAKRRERIRNQLKVVEGLLGELDILDGENTNLCGQRKSGGNLNWYLKELFSFNPSPWHLDHPINKINFNSYLSNFDKTICERIDIQELIRTISYINDKISQINFWTEYSRTKGSYTKSIISYLANMENGIIKEAQSIIRDFRLVLSLQKTILEKDVEDINKRILV